MSPTLQYAWPALSGRGRPAGLLSGANVDHEIFAQVLLSGKAPQIPT